VEKLIIADIGLTAADLVQRNQRGAVCLISGDSDFGYLLSRLRGRSQIASIILITGMSPVSEALKSQADFVIPLFDALIEKPNRSQHSKTNIPKKNKEIENMVRDLIPFEKNTAVAFHLNEPIVLSDDDDDQKLSDCRIEKMIENSETKSENNENSKKTREK